VGEAFCIGENPPPWHSIASLKSELMAIPAAEIRRHPTLPWKVLESYQRRLRTIEIRQALASTPASKGRAGPQFASLFYVCRV
jgi:hypothetical protein